MRYLRLGVILILIVAGLIIGSIAKSNARKGSQPINAGNLGGATATESTVESTQAIATTQAPEPTAATYPASDQYGPIDRSRCPVGLPSVGDNITYAQLDEYLFAVDKAVAAGEKTRNVDCLSEFMANGAPSPVLFDRPAQPKLAFTGAAVPVDAAGKGDVSGPADAKAIYSGQELEFGYIDQNGNVTFLFGLYGGGAYRFGLAYVDTTSRSNLY